MFLEKCASSFAQPDATWGALTPAQRDIVRADYPALEYGDDPPYPLNGMRALSAGTAEVYRHFPAQQGRMLTHVLIGVDGKPKTVATFGAPLPDLAH